MIRTSQNQITEFQTKVALKAIKDDKTLASMSEYVAVHPN
jgi:hypothetical protein